MKVKTVWVKYDRVFDLGAENQINLSVTLQADLDDDENHIVAIKTLQDDARDSVRNEYSRIPKKGSSTTAPAVS